jgi:hypothetical protein
MSAGSGIRHSEFNHSKQEPVHFLQIWVLPDREGISPRYDQKTFSASRKAWPSALIGSPDGRDDSIVIHQDVEIFAALLELPATPLRSAFAAGRKGLGAGGPRRRRGQRQGGARGGRCGAGGRGDAQRSRPQRTTPSSWCSICHRNCGQLRHRVIEAIVDNSWQERSSRAETTH